MKYDFDKLVDRKGTNSIKWEFMSMGVEGADEETLPFWIADMDFPCAKPILDAMHERIDRQIFGYSSPYTEEYLSAVTGWFSRRYTWEIDPEDIVVSPGVVPALGFLIRFLTQEGDGIILQRPVYYPFTEMIEDNNREVINNPLINQDGKYYMNFEDLEEKAKDPNNKMLILCNPHNPIGRVWTEEELRKLTKICLDNDVIIISDEIHCDLLRKNQEFIPLGKLVDDDRIIICTAPSKTFNLAGLKISNIVIRNKEFREKWDKEVMGKSGIHGANSLGIVATEAAYNDGEDWLEQVIDYIDDNFKFIDEYLKVNLPKAKFFIPEGTYFAWIDLREYGHTHLELKDLMVTKAKVALDEGYIFGEGGEGYERINVACPRDLLKKCLDNMTKVLEG